MTDAEISARFPPPLIVGARVWTIQGYPDHGPMNGLKVNIAGDQGGTVQATTQPCLTMPELLYTVCWDNGQTSSHYANGLFCIGRFITLDDFRNAIIPQEPVEVILGPQGGFREAKLTLTYDGHPQMVHLFQYDRHLWSGFVEPVIRAQGLTITEKRLPPASRKKTTARQHLCP